MIKLEFLEWDSRFFEKSIFRYDLKQGEDIQLVKNKLYNLRGDLCYVYSKHDLGLENCDSLFLADRKVVYHKTNLDFLRMTECENIKVTHTFTRQLMDLALLSGRYSRFFRDKFLELKFMSMYSIWLERSLTRELADEVFVYEVDNEQLGFVTIKKEISSAVVGLIAVNEASQGQNIGTKLLQKVEKWSYNRGLDTLEVATQMDNHQACSFYEKNNYQIKQIDYIYHCYA